MPRGRATDGETHRQNALRDEDKGFVSATESCLLEKREGCRTAGTRGIAPTCNCQCCGCDSRFRGGFLVVLVPCCHWSVFIELLLILKLLSTGGEGRGGRRVEERE